VYKSAATSVVEARGLHLRHRGGCHYGKLAEHNALVVVAALDSLGVRQGSVANGDAGNAAR
jgi:hypothetical protein